MKPKANEAVTVDAPNVYARGFFSRPGTSRSGLGDPDGGAVLLAVGAALTNFEGAQECLTHLFLLVTDTLNAKSSYSTMAAFGCVENIKTKLDMIKPAAEFYFHPYSDEVEIKLPLIKLCEAVQAAGRLRNDVAHGKVQSFSIDQKGSGFFLVAAGYATFRNEKRLVPSEENLYGLVTSQYRFTSEDVSEIAAKFALLQRAIVDYTYSIVRSGSDNQPPRNTASLQQADERKEAERLQRKLNRKAPPT